MEGYRAQFEEISSALEAKLTSFIQTSEQAAQKQACLFDARIASTSEQAISLAHENLRTEIMRVQESTTHSVEEQIASLVVGLQQSHAQIEAMSAKLDDSRLRYNSELEYVQQRTRELSQQAIECTAEALKQKEPPLRGRKECPPRRKLHGLSVDRSNTC